MTPLQKISLRRIEKEDIPLLWQWSRNEELSFFNAFTTNKSRAEFEREYESRVGNPDLVDFLILHGAGETPVGFCGIKDINWVDRCGELFISICEEKARKNGVATIAVLITAKIAFYELNLNKIYARVASHNERQLKMMTDWGFVHEGTLREMHYHNDFYYDVRVYGILRREAAAFLQTTVEKAARYIFPGCGDEMLAQIREIVASFMGNVGSPGGSTLMLKGGVRA